MSKMEEKNTNIQADVQQELEMLTDVNPEILNEKFQDIKEDKDKMNAIVERWSKFDFLQGLPEEKAMEIAFYFEQLAAYFLGLDNNEKTEDDLDTLSVISFALLRRTAEVVPIEQFDIHKFIKYLYEYDYQAIAGMIQVLTKIYEVESDDIMAESVALASDMMITAFYNAELKRADVYAATLAKVSETLKNKKEQNDITQEVKEEDKENE